MTAPAQITRRPVGADVCVVCSGAWTLHGLSSLQRSYHQFNWPKQPETILDCQDIEALDTTGAWLLYQIQASAVQAGGHLRWAGLKPKHQQLLTKVTQTLEQAEPCPTEAPAPPWLQEIGQTTLDKLNKSLCIVSFIGQITVYLLQHLTQPWKLRWRAFFSNLYTAGVEALPIVGLLTFLIGVVVTYQGGVQLRSFGANIFIVDLIGVSLLRELAPLIVAILVAGRTGSAYTAQIGTMQVNEEIDAMRTMGLSPIAILVIPKLLALMLVLPLLTILADLFGILGGMVIANLILDVSHHDFIDRFQESISITTLWIGVIKAPVFAALIALIGCYQGFAVTGGADSVGQQTTISVVQGIFMVIVVDAAFSIVLNWLGI